MSLSKSRYIDYKQCPKKLWLNTYKRDLADEMDQGIFTMGTRVGEMARDLFPGGVLVEYNQDDRYNIKKMLKKTTELIEQGTEVIYEAAFSDGETIAICDILVKNSSGYDMCEVKASTSVKDVHIQDLSFQCHVLQSCRIEVKNIYLVYVNRLYTRHGELELSKLFLAEDLTDVIKKNTEIIKADLLKTTDILNMKEEPVKDIGMHCTKPYACQFQGHCYKHIPNNSIFDLAGVHKKKKFNLYYDGIITFEDIVNRKVKLVAKAQAQLDSELNNTKIIDREAIKDFLDTLWYTMYFLDFETINSAVPLYEGTRPYQQVPTQYSLHYIEEENGELHHREFLAPTGVDPRRPLAEQLVKDIPNNACVLAYNMSFEKSVIAMLARLNPDLESHLINIHSNNRDLMLPFQKKYIYLKEMHGSHSIKAVLPALFPDDKELSYNNLKGVHNGQEASAAYLALPYMSDEEQDETRRQLFEYCRLDTLAMVRIWERLRMLV